MPLPLSLSLPLSSPLTSFGLTVFVPFTSVSHHSSIRTLVSEGQVLTIVLAPLLSESLLSLFYFVLIFQMPVILAASCLIILSSFVTVFVPPVLVYPSVSVHFPFFFFSFGFCLTNWCCSCRGDKSPRWCCFVVVRYVYQYIRYKHIIFCSMIHRFIQRHVNVKCIRNLIHFIFTFTYMNTF